MVNCSGQQMRAGERAMAEAMVGMAEPPDDEGGCLDLLNQLSTECLGRLPVDAAGVLLSEQGGALRPVPGSVVPARLLELFERQGIDGPARDCLSSSDRISAGVSGPDRWPGFTARMTESGFAEVHVLAMRARTETIGVLVLLAAVAGAVRDEDLRIAQAMANLVTITMLRARQLRHSTMLNDQLRTALNSRVVIEQAKGMLAERHHVDVTTAFRSLRSHARSHNQQLTEVAQSVLDGVVQIPRPRDGELPQS